MESRQASFIANNSNFNTQGTPKSKLSGRLNKIKESFNKELSIAQFKELDRILLDADLRQLLISDTFVAGRFHKLYSNALQQLGQCRVETSRQLFTSIPKEEFSKITSKNPEERRAYNENSTDFNNCSMYIKLDILLSSTFAESMLAIERWCHVLRVAKESHDYNSIFSIISALNSTAISILIGDINENTYLTSEAKKNLVEANYLTSYRSNFKNIRSAMDGNTQFVPYLGIYSKDFTAIKENDDIEKNESAQCILTLLDKAQKENKALKSAYILPAPWKKENILAAFKEIQIPVELCVGAYYRSQPKNEILELEKSRRVQIKKLKSGEIDLFSESDEVSGIINDLFSAVAHTLTHKHNNAGKLLSEINELLGDERTFFEAPAILRKTAKDSISSSSPSPSSASSQTGPFLNFGRVLSKSTEEKSLKPFLEQKVTRVKSNSMEAPLPNKPSGETDANENTLRSSKPSIKRTLGYPDLTNSTNFRLFRILSETKKYEEKQSNANDNNNTGAVNPQKDSARPPKLMYKQSYKKINLKKLDDPRYKLNPEPSITYNPIGCEYPSLARARKKEELLSPLKSKSPLKTTNVNPPKAPKPFKTILEEIKEKFTSSAPYVDIRKLLPERKAEETLTLPRRPHSI